MHKIKHNSKWVTIGTLCILAILSLGTMYMNRQTYARYVSTSSLSQARALRMNYTDSKRLEYDFTYKGSCPNCMKLQSTIAPLIHQKKKHHVPMIVLNEDDASLKKYFIQNNLLDHYPTVSVRYHGDLIYQYTGHNKQTFKEIFHGIDPSTDKHFKHHVPAYSHIQDSIDHTTQNKPTV